MAGLLSRITGGGLAAQVATNVLPFPSQLPTDLASPWTDSQLPAFVYEDVFGQSGIVTRAQAMSVPAVAAARAVIISTLAGAPLRALVSDGQRPQQPTWLDRTNGVMGPWQRMAHTLDDLMFHGDCVWATKRGADGFPIDMQHLPRTHWKVDPHTGRIRVPVNLATDHWRDARDDEVIYIPGAFEGLLKVAADTIRGALDLERNWRNQARVPLPGIILQEREDNGMTPGEMQEWVKAVADNRRKVDGAVMGVPYKVQATVAAPASSDLMVEGRNAVKLDIANFLGLNPSMLGAALPKASLNYETQQGTRQEFLERLGFQTGPIEARLSMDDVVPGGTRVRFDFNPTPNPDASSTGPTMED